LLAVLDLTADPAPTPPPDEPWAPNPLPNPAQAWNAAISEQWAMNLRAWSEMQRNLLDARAQFRGMTDFTRAIQTTLPAAFRRPTQTNWNRRVSQQRRAAWTGVSFQEIRGIRSRLGGTVNDVVLTILGGALGRYLQDHGIDTKDRRIRFMIPVNVRQESEKGALGNRVSMMLPEIPIGITSAAERLQAVRDEMERLKSSEQAGAFDSMRRMADNLPAAFHAIAGMGGVPPGQVNLVCTNVPGPLIPLFAVGHRMLGHYPLVPLAGDLGIGVGVTSYNTGLYIGVMADPSIIGDVDRIRDLIDDEFRVLRYMADVPVTDLPEFSRAARGANGNSARKRAPKSASGPRGSTQDEQPVAAAPAEPTG
jgi:WS/DGAT/MGAT family acyltransferase